VRACRLVPTEDSFRRLFTAINFSLYSLAYHRGRKVDNGATISARELPVHNGTGVLGPLLVGAFARSRRLPRVFMPALF
jgi:hypothetical protein